MPSFPSHRPRRLRRSETIRSLVRETSLLPSDLILPLFVVPGEGVRRPVASMAGVEQTSADELLRDAEEALRLGIGGVLLFGIPEHKDEAGSSGYGGDNIVSRAVRRIKAELPGLLVMTDVCLCEYTSHGHCGVIRDGDVDNDATVPLLARMAVAHAAAGADVVAPSDMMDGRVGAIRKALDDAGHTETAILSYAAKYASAFYGPFRDVAESAPTFGDRRTAQMDPGNVLEALREARLDVDEGADILMVKPALAYLDVIHRVKAETGYPVCAYHVSGEYAMIVAAAERGWIDGDRAQVEALTAIKRAGADMVISYYARQFARRSGG
ncbi:MAG: Porphobilinogen synthase [uncultured Gemmatimonadetes bacterium]|uniref:Delta-aminolevulinic acid dehydratase n=1 Tax=uncultured Gemmatimonadota bacterium TaxID=203437 RepID=A0A6J4N3M9_9BACT|nr:MAG: Porphobilinogen synthase [uncultured Gemmatimonadota bacterium]